MGGLPGKSYDFQGLSHSNREEKSQLKLTIGPARMPLENLNRWKLC